MMSDLKIFKLVNGEDIIGFLETYNNEDLKDIDKDSPDVAEGEEIVYDHLLFIRDPMRMYSAYSAKQKRHELYLTKWIAYTDDSLFVIPKDLVITIATPSQQVAEHYYELSDGEYITRSESSTQILSEEQQMQKEYKEFLENWEVDDEEKKKMN